MRGRSSSVTTNKQVADERVHLVDVSEEVAEKLVGQVVGQAVRQVLLIARAGVRHGHLELGALRGERAPQVVGDVGHEPPLLLLGLLDPAEHPVHRARRDGRPRRPGPRCLPRRPTRRERSSSVMVSTSARIRSRRRSARPTSSHDAATRSSQTSGTPTRRPARRLAVASRTDSRLVPDVHADPATAGRGSGGGPEPVLLGLVVVGTDDVLDVEAAGGGLVGQRRGAPAFGEAATTRPLVVDDLGHRVVGDVDERRPADHPTRPGPAGRPPASGRGRRRSP